MAGCVYAVGGFNSSLRERTVDIYDGARDQWSAAASMQERRSTLGAAVLGDLLYAVGGFNGSIGTHPLRISKHILRSLKIQQVLLVLEDYHTSNRSSGVSSFCLGFKLPDLTKTREDGKHFKTHQMR